MQIEHVRIAPLSERLEDELDAATRQALANQEMIEPTEAEKKNGWTRESLTEYLAERMAAQEMVVDVNSLHRRAARRPDESNHRYNPLRWRG